MGWKRLKAWGLRVVLSGTLKRAWARIPDDKRQEMMDWLDGKKTYISAVLLGLALMAEQLGWVSVSSSVNELGEVVSEGSWLTALQKLLAVAVAIFLRAGVEKSG